MKPCLRRLGFGLDLESACGLLAIVCGGHWLIAQPFSHSPVYALLDGLVRRFPGPSEFVWGGLLVLLGGGRLALTCSPSWVRTRLWIACANVSLWIVLGGLIYLATPWATYAWVMLWVAYVEAMLFFQIRRGEGCDS